MVFNCDPFKISCLPTCYGLMAYEVYGSHPSLHANMLTPDVYNYNMCKSYVFNLLFVYTELMKGWITCVDDPLIIFLISSWTVRTRAWDDSGSSSVCVQYTWREWHCLKRVVWFLPSETLVKEHVRSRFIFLGDTKKARSDRLCRERWEGW